jgi:hypothetical protein
MDEIPSIVVNKKEVLINNKPVIVLDNGKIPPADIQQGAAFPVYKALLEIAEVNKKAAEVLRASGSTDEKKAKPGEITIEMDKKHSFEILRRIMLAGQQAEFITFKLLVAKPNID